MASGGVRIVDSVVESAVRAGRRSVDAIDGGQFLADSIADAITAYGPLRNTVKDAEASWRLNRTKLLETLRSLVDTVEAVNDSFDSLDDEMTQGMQGQDGSTSNDRPQPPPRGGAPVQPADAGAGNAAGTPTQPWPVGEVAPLAPPPRTEAAAPLTAPEPPSGEDGALPVGTDLAPDRVAALQLFAHRLADLTGRSPAEMEALLLSAFAVGGVAAVTSLSAALAGSGTAAKPADPVQVQNGPTAPENEAPVAPPESDSPAAPDHQAESGTPEQPIAEDQSPSDPDVEGGESQPSTDNGPDEPQPEGDVPPEPAVDERVEPPRRADGVSSEDQVALRPEASASLPAAPVLGDLPPLAVSEALPSLGGEAGGSGVAPDLPPLEPLVATAGPSGSRVAPGEGAALPPLTVESITPASANDVPRELPDLAVTEPPAAARPMGGMPMTMGGLGAAGGTTPVTSGTSPKVGSAERSADRREASDVLNEQAGGSHR